MEFVFIVVCIAGVLLIYFANKKQAERLERHKHQTEMDNWYKNRLFHIVVNSINESDDSEYLRAAQEQRKLKEVGNQDVKVYTCVFRDELGYHDETWEEYQARLVCFIKEKEAERHAEIRKIDPQYYRRWVLGKKMPETACLFLIADTDKSFVVMVFLAVVIMLGWFFDSLTATGQKPKNKPKTAPKQEKTIQVNGVIYRALPPPPNK